ncbi:lysophospholipid acyltransferase family protein [Croceibacterium ferulae]|uniref:lysophospholipid acyltransferase family protein n=1 Tax=Croceibacterium ferulae TaxID=1854641 RepID=UPI001F4E282B|nr:lysophospholipid acyltransferase family protein [Croceibacterium ferulae]
MRIAGIVALFAAIILPHLLLSLVGLRRVIPPHFLGAVGWLAGLRVTIVGRPARGQLLLIGNHTSWLDILALGGACRAAFVAKGTLANNRLLGWLCAQNDTLFIARERRGAVGQQVGQLRAALARRRMCVFPEGTTGDGTRLLPFKSALLSAAESATGVTVQPVAFDYEDAPAIAWTDAEPGGDNIRRLLARREPIRLTIRFLPPLDPAALVSRKTMAEAAQSRIAAALALPIGGPIP